MTKHTQIIIIVLIGLFILGMALYPQIKERYFTNQENMPASPPAQSSSSTQALSVNAKIIKYEKLIDIFRTKGTLIPDEEVNLSFEASGKIINIYFKEGTYVKSGELLAKMNDKLLLAELKKLEVQIPLAKGRVFRQKSLLEKDAVSQEAYESVATELDELQANIELVESQIAQTEIRAPFDGQIGLRFVSKGAYATPETVISTLTKITPLKLEFAVNESQANNIRPGSKVDFTVGGNLLDKYEAEVYAVEPRLDGQTITLKARALYDNSNGKLKPGSSANIEIVMNEYDEALTVPSIAIVAELGIDMAYLYKSGIARRVILTKGMRTASSVQIVDGLQDGDTLIISGVMQLRDEMPVKISVLNE